LFVFFFLLKKKEPLSKAKLTTGRGLPNEVFDAKQDIVARAMMDKEERAAQHEERRKRDK
jgi:hypothetical protein